MIKSKYRMGGCSYRPVDIVEDLRANLGVNISYEKAWRAREHALDTVRGSPDDSYALLPLYCDMLKSNNPGSVIHIKTDEKGRFKYFFVNLHASLKGWAYCKPVIAVDGTFMKCKFLGTLFVAVAKDANNQIFPLAFGVGDSENDASWEWFFTKLWDAIGVRDEMVIISDRHPSLEKALTSVFPDVEHGICMQHLLQNAKNKFKGLAFEALYYMCAKAYKLSEFEHFMRQLRRIDLRIPSYLEEVGYARWARSHFSGRRYDILTTNIAESMNAALTGARDLPITSLVEAIRNLLQRWFWERRATAADLTTPLSSWAEDELRKKNNASLVMTVHSCSFHCAILAKSSLGHEYRELYHDTSDSYHVVRDIGQDDVTIITIDVILSTQA